MLPSTTEAIKMVIRVSSFKLQVLGLMVFVSLTSPVFLAKLAAQNLRAREHEQVRVGVRVSVHVRVCVRVREQDKKRGRGRGETPFCNMACTHHFTRTNSHQTCLSSGQRERERERGRKRIYQIKSIALVICLNSIQLKRYL